jgi:hypothetical protein
MTLPAKEYFDFILCEEIRQESGNKVSLLGVLAGGIVIDTHQPEESEDNYTLPQLCFYFNFRDGEGSYKAQLEILDPKGTIIIENDIGELKKKPLSSMTFYATCRPFHINTFGEYTARLTLDDTPYEGRFLVKSENNINS